MTRTIIAMPKYERYKDSGIDWLGEIPFKWSILPGMKFFRERLDKNKGMIESRVLSLSYGNIIVKPEEKLVGLVPESFETYQIVDPDDIIVRCTDLQNDQTSLRIGLAKNRGIITSAYLNLQPRSRQSSHFLHYYLHALDLIKVLYKFGSGLRQNLSFDDFKHLPIPFMSYEEQEAIAKFLDEKTEQIDRAIEIKKRQISLLKERKQAIIQKAVTKGLNPNVTMKDSGIDWLGEIPEHWGVKRLKYVLSSKSVKINSKDSDLKYLGMDSIEAQTGKVLDGNVEVEGLANYFDKGDILFGKLRPYLKKVHLAKTEGICSTEFLIYSPQGHDGKFYSNFLIGDQFINAVNSSTYGSKMPRANSNFIGNLQIVVPPKDEQAKIASYIKVSLAQVDKAMDLQQAQIDKLKEYKASLINSAVTGKIKII